MAIIIISLSETEWLLEYYLLDVCWLFTSNRQTSSKFISTITRVVDKFLQRYACVGVEVLLDEFDTISEFHMTLNNRIRSMYQAFVQFLSYTYKLVYSFHLEAWVEGRLSNEVVCTRNGAQKFVLIRLDALCLHLLLRPNKTNISDVNRMQPLNNNIIIIWVFINGTNLGNCLLKVKSPFQVNTQIFDIRLIRYLVNIIASHVSASFWTLHLAKKDSSLHSCFLTTTCDQNCAKIVLSSA